jgi:diadenylate cyclase
VSDENPTSIDDTFLPSAEDFSAALRSARPPGEGPRRDPRLLDSIARVAPGTRLRGGIEDIIRSGEGALIVIGDPQKLSFLYSGGIPLNLKFSSQFLYELAKMDGAIVVNESISRLAYANVQLMPDPAIPSRETGTRHRTAERVAKQTGALVIAISQERETLTLFVDDHRYLLGRVPEVLARANQALATLEAYRRRLDQQLARLTSLELSGAVRLEDVLGVVQRAEMSTRVGQEIECDYIELGSEGRLIRLQLEELIHELPGEKRALIRDYHAAGGNEADKALGRLSKLSSAELVETELLLQLLAYRRRINPFDHRVEPRGYRALSHVPRLSGAAVSRIVNAFGGLSAIMAASEEELRAVEGIGSNRVRDIKDGLRGLRELDLG